MALSSNLVSQFAKAITNTETKEAEPPKEELVTFN